jgi:hypothetical protein
MEQEIAQLKAQVEALTARVNKVQGWPRTTGLIELSFLT